MKIRLVGAELLHADRRTDMTKLIVAFLNFENTSKMIYDFMHLNTCILLGSPTDGLYLK